MKNKNLILFVNRAIISLVLVAIFAGVAFAAATSQLKTEACAAETNGPLFTCFLSGVEDFVPVVSGKAPGEFLQSTDSVFEETPDNAEECKRNYAVKEPVFADIIRTTPNIGDPVLFINQTVPCHLTLPRDIAKVDRK